MAASEADLIQRAQGGTATEDDMQALVVRHNIYDYAGTYIYNRLKAVYGENIIGFDGFMAQHVRLQEGPEAIARAISTLPQLKRLAHSYGYSASTSPHCFWGSGPVSASAAASQPHFCSTASAPGVNQQWDAAFIRLCKIHFGMYEGLRHGGHIDCPFAEFIIPCPYYNSTPANRPPVMMLGNYLKESPMLNALSALDGGDGGFFVTVREMDNITPPAHLEQVFQINMAAIDKLLLEIDDVPAHETAAAQIHHSLHTINGVPGVQWGDDGTWFVGYSRGKGDVQQKIDAWFKHTSEAVQDDVENESSPNTSVVSPLGGKHTGILTGEQGLDTVVSAIQSIYKELGSTANVWADPPAQFPWFRQTRQSATRRASYALHCKLYPRRTSG